MTKSYAEMADDILGGALTDSAKNPYDPTQGHQASMPAMNPKDTLLEMTDAHRAQLLSYSIGEKVPTPEPIVESHVAEKEDSTPSEWGSPTITMELTPQELQTLSEAKRIITKIQEATTVGTIGVNMAGGTPSPKPKKQTIPGDVNVAALPKKRAKKAKPKNEHYDFMSYLKA